MPEIALALGSNIGDRVNYLCSAIDLLFKKIAIKDVSTWFENPAVGGPEGQGDYLNGAVVGSTSLTPYELLSFIKEIEFELGRDLNAARWTARVIDIDIIFYGDAVINTHALTVPHALMQERAFVLIPLCELIPHYIHPVLNCSVRELLAGIE